MAMIFCSSCGKENPPEAVNCVYCNAPLVKPVYSRRNPDEKEGIIGKGYEEEFKGIFRSLFDFAFKSLIAKRVLKFLYGLSVIILCIGYFVAIKESISTAHNLHANSLVEFFAFIGLFILSSIVFTFVLIFIRVYYELVIAFIYIAEDVRIIRERK